MRVTATPIRAATIGGCTADTARRLEPALRGSAAVSAGSIRAARIGGCTADTAHRLEPALRGSAAALPIRLAASNPRCDDGRLYRRAR
ncbi:MAG: hypothetical protein ABI895_40730, partial [Deltaproteobacteria bacterium]